jgi:hypothetical protein
VLLLILLPTVGAIEVNVGIIRILLGKISVLTYRADNMLKLTTEFFNSGSLGYKARARLDVFNESKTIFTGWSSEKILKPGMHTSFEMFWVPNINGNFTGRVRFYYGYETLESNMTFSLTKKECKNVFEVMNIRTYDNYMTFLLRANETVNNTLIIPSGYPVTWIFEQVRLDKVDGQITRISVPFIADVWEPTDMTMTIATEDGNYCAIRRFDMQKEERGLLMYINMLIDNIRVILNI